MSRTNRFATFSALGALLATGVAVTAEAQPRPPARLSVASTGEQANAGSRLLNISRTGRFVLFRSLASNLVAGDTNGVADLFVRDRDADVDDVLDEPGAAATVRVSIGTGGTQADRVCSDGWLSADGRFVLFATEASTLVPGDTNGVSDVFVRDRDTDADGVFDEPAATSTTRISEGTGGVQADAASFLLTLTPDGRHAFFTSAAANLSSIPVNGVHQIYRKDRASGVLTLVTSSINGVPAASPFPTNPHAFVSASDDGQVVAFVARADSFAAAEHGGAVFVRDLAVNTLLALPLVRDSLPTPPYGPRPQPGITPDGTMVFFTIEDFFGHGGTLSHSGTVHSFERRTGRERQVARGIGPRFAGESRYLVFPAFHGGVFCFGYDGLYRFDRVTGTTSILSRRQISDYSTSGSAKRALIRTLSQADCAGGGGSAPPLPTVYLIDEAFGGEPVAMPSPVRPGQMDDEGTHVVFESDEATIMPPGSDTNAVADVFAVDLESRLDQDSDALDDRWEAATGLSYTSAGSADGPSGDPDGDGLTNLQELQARSHPRGAHIRYLAEGADNAFFRTRIALANPDVNPVTVVLRFLADGGGTQSAFVTVPPRARRTLEAREVAGLPSQSFSIIVESDGQVAIDRTMSWDATGYGAHAERALAGASTTWFLAEGSTTGEFGLFYLLQNPGATPAMTTIRYLRPAGLAPIERTYVLPPQSRTTIPVNTQAPELASTDVSAAITADSPILVERSMYLTRGGQPFAAGHASAGVTSAATDWFLAEGATGPFFDLFLLIANPSATDATVDARYLLTGGEVLTKTYDVAANSRLTIYVDAEQFPGRGRALAHVAVSTTLTSTNAVPIVVERAMWFPGPEITPAFWSEAHNSPGSTSTATRWVLADGEDGGPANVRTFVLVANTSSFEGRVRVTPLTETGSGPSGIFVVPANSRTTIPVGDLAEGGARFGVLVESVETPTLAQLVVERAMYWDVDGVVWAAGTNVLGTPVP